MNYTILILYRATHHSLALTRQQRNEFFSSEILPIVQQFEGRLTVRFFDSEAFHATTSDFLIINCEELQDYYYFMEYVRDTALFSKLYIELNDIITGIENGFQHFEEKEKSGYSVNHY